MLKIMKIKSIHLAHQHNSEHLGFGSEILGKLKKYVPVAIDVPILMLIGFEQAINAEDESYKILAKSAFTEELSKRDALSDSTLVGFATHTRAFLTHYDPEFQAAANRIMVEYNAYGNIRRKNYMAQATDTINLLQALNGKYQADIALLGLDGWVVRIEETHNSFMELFNERQDEQAEKNALARLRDCRIATDGAYRAIVDRVNAGIVFNGETKYKNLVVDLNVSIDYYNNIMATRKGRAAAEREKKKNSEQAGSEQSDG